VAPETMLRGGRYVGEPIKRVEDPRLLRGGARFMDDIALPRMVHAAFVRSPFAHAAIRSIDASAALQLDGVIAVFTGRDLQDQIGRMVVPGVPLEEALATSRDALAIDKARHVGDPVAVVIASTPYLAEDGRDAVAIEWEQLPVVLDPVAALQPDATLLDEALGTNNLAHYEKSAGDIETAFAEADHVFTKTFHVGRSTAGPMEGRGVIADYDERGGGHMTVWASSQFPHFLRMLLAPMLGMPEGRVSVKVPDVGGAFGLKCTVFPEDVVVPAVARRLGRPVKWVEDRWENLAASVHSKEMLCTIEIGVDADGTFKGFRGHYVTDAGAYSSMPFTPLVDSMPAASMIQNLYKVDHVAFSIDNPMTNKCQLGAVRGVGWASGQTARETAIDDVARALDIDPVHLRLKNIMTSEPQRNAFGAKYDGGSYAEALEVCRDTVGYEALRKRQNELRRQGRYIGVGFSPFVEPTGWATKSGIAQDLPIPFFDTASVTMEPDGSVTITTGLHSHGQGHETTFAQVAADQLGLPMSKVRIVYGDTDTSAFGSGTWASRSAVIATGSITHAAGEIRDRLLRLAGTLLEASHEDIELTDDRAQVKGAPSRSLSIAEVSGFGYFGGTARPEDVQKAGLTATSGYDPEETYSNGCAAVVVEVDVDTGMVTIEQLVAVEDCGTVLNPMIVKGQVAGAVAMGIGMALLEGLVYDEQGEFVSGSLMHYLFPSTGEVPHMDLKHIETPSPTNVGGVKGVGEGGTIAVPAAIVNAISDAISPFGVSVDQTPVTPTYLLSLLRSARGA
jgi:carbon-monoxide dehydrogenase large subunit